MANPILNIDTKHNDMIHDAQLDYYAKKLATCSSDRTIKIFNINGEQSFEHVHDLHGHDGPVWQVSWAHPKFGVLLASCSYDKRVLVHREVSPNNWQEICRFEDMKSSINSVTWGPHEYDLSFACCSSDGQVAVLTHNAGDNWVTKKFDDCKAGVNAVSWAPYAALGAHEEGVAVRRLVTGGCDKMVRIWALRDGEDEWKLEHALEGHGDWVRDVAWAPSVGLSYNTMASCSEDGKVFVWTQSSVKGEWTKEVPDTFDGPVWRVSWSVTGNVLAVSSGDATVTLYKESLDRKWVKVNSVDDEEGGDPTQANVTQQQQQLQG